MEFGEKPGKTEERTVNGIDKIDVAGEDVYYLKSSVSLNYVDIYRMGTDGKTGSAVSRVVTAMAGEDAEEDGLSHFALRFDRLFFTGQDYILWSAQDKKVFVVEANRERTVTVLGPAYTESFYTESVGNYVLSEAVNERLLSLMLGRYGCDVQLLTYPTATYESRLSTKLMAGDDDFDVFLLYNTNQSLLRSVLENSAFVPLETLGEGEKVKAEENIDAMLPSLSAALHTEKGILGVPVLYAGPPLLKAAPREVWEQYGLDYPTENGFTVESYLALCDAIAALDPTLLLRTADLTTYLLADFAERYVREGEADLDTLTKVMETCLRSYTTGGAYYSAELDGVDVYETGKLTFLLTLSETAEEEDADYFLLPEVMEGTTYLTVSAFACVNPASKHREEAADYLACLSEEAYSRTSPDGEQLFYPNLALYTGFSHSKAEEERFDKAEDLLAARTVLLRVTDERLIFGSGKWRELSGKMNAGTVSAREAAEEFLDIVRWMYME